jgi:hypothetical protein
MHDDIIFFHYGFTCMKTSQNSYVEVAEGQSKVTFGTCSLNA